MLGSLFGEDDDTVGLDLTAYSVSGAMKETDGGRPNRICLKVIYLIQVPLSSTGRK
jgi:hypothetical protein